MASKLDQRCKALIAELGLAKPNEVQAVTPLTGGVASDIARVDLPDRRLCVKFALPKLKVAADWFAPVHRNAAEYAWLSVAKDAAPESGVALYGHSASQNGFAMAFLEGADVRLWKADLLNGHLPASEAARVASVLGKVHAASTRPGFDQTPFQNQQDFHALRVEPYLSYTASIHPALRLKLDALEVMLGATSQALVHGDASPKNILFKGDNPVLLDAECATMGDPCFDVAFCMNHLVLKAVHLPDSRAALIGELRSLWAAYQPHVSWEPAHDIEARVCALLPALMLARIDGKSPVEYLSDNARKLVRGMSIELINAQPNSVSEFATRLTEHLKGPPS